MSRIVLDDSTRKDGSSQLPTLSLRDNDDRGGTVATKLKRWAADINAMSQDLYGAVIQVATSRNLASSDNGLTLECTAAAITLTVPAGLGASFGCAVIPNGTTSIASAGGTLLNGATTTLTRADTSNVLFALVERASAVDSYVVTGS